MQETDLLKIEFIGWGIKFSSREQQALGRAESIRGQRFISLPPRKGESSDRQDVCYRPQLVP